MISDARIAEIQSRLDKAPVALLLDAEILFRVFRAMRNVMEKRGEKLAGDLSGDWDVAEVLAQSPRDLHEVLAELRRLRAVFDDAPHQKESGQC